jgi:hypothetical protein
MIETIAALSFILAAVLAYVAHKRNWKIADFLSRLKKRRLSILKIYQ